MPEIYYIYHDNFLSFMTLQIIYKGRCGSGYVLEKKKTKYFPSCVYVFVCVHMHTFVYVYLYTSQHMCAYMWCQRPTSGCPFPLLSTCFCYYCCLPACFWGRASHFYLELTDLSGLPVTEPQGSICSCFFRAITMSLCYHIRWLLCGFLGSNSGLQALTESTFYPPSYLPSPHWEGSLQMLIGGKRNLNGGKRGLFG